MVEKISRERPMCFMGKSLTPQKARDALELLEVDEQSYTELAGKGSVAMQMFAAEELAALARIALLETENEVDYDTVYQKVKTDLEN